MPLRGHFNQSNCVEDGFIVYKGDVGEILTFEPTLNMKHSEGRWGERKAMVDGGQDQKAMGSLGSKNNLWIV